MREMLEPIFGASGAVVAQFIITLIVVLALVAVVVWLVRRYAAGGLGMTVRGRLPRLAVVDAMAVDNRRKLVLVRRDNVEHLILIGGPADLVVEPGIVRTRTQSQRSATVASAARPQPSEPASDAAPEAPPVEPPAPRRAEPSGADQPIPFPPRRVERPIARRDLPRQVAPAPAREEPRRAARPAAVETLAAEEEARITPFLASPPPVHGEPASEPPPADVTMAEAPQPAPSMAMEESYADAPGATESSDEVELPQFLSPSAQDEGEPTDLAASDAQGMPGESEAPLPDGEGATAVRVNDLEKEMARLLGEISNRRSS